mmetsp:Transcript_134297/g.287241  ORF Transcript_134297/g.287241 Transcript_134297/m.287241 type:complete len:98 (+) Transcript_134297:267-560(+)
MKKRARSTKSLSNNSKRNHTFSACCIASSVSPGDPYVITWSTSAPITTTFVMTRTQLNTSNSVRFTSCFARLRNAPKFSSLSFNDDENESDEIVFMI